MDKMQNAIKSQHLLLIFCISYQLLLNLWDISFFRKRSKAKLFLFMSYSFSNKEREGHIHEWATTQKEESIT